MVKKKIFAGILLATLFIGTSSVSANSSGNGWTSGSIRLNKVNYNCTVSIAGASQKAAKTTCTTTATASRIHGDVTYRYRSKNDGILSRTKGGRSWGYRTGTTSSYEVNPYSEYSPFVDYVSVQGNVKVTTRDQDGTTRTYSFTPKLAK